MTWEGLEGSGAHSERGSYTVAGGAAPAGLLRADWLLPLLHAPSPRSGSQLSEASREVWDLESLQEPGPGVEPVPGHSSLAGGSSSPEPSLYPAPFLGPGEGQEDSGTNRSLTSGSNTGKTKRKFPEAACTALPPQTSSSGDLCSSLSFLSGTSASEGGDFGRGRETGPLQVLAGHPEEPWGVDPSPSADRKPLEASPEPDPRSPQAPPGDPSGLAAPRAESQAPRFVGSRAPPALEEVCPPVAGGVLPEVLSPTDEVLSYGSATLPPSTHRDTCLPPLPPNVLAEREADPAHPHSEGFPSLPEDTWSPWGALGAPGEDASILTGELPSLSEEGLPAALSLGPQESGLCLGVAGQGRNCGDELGESSSIGGHQAMGGQWAEPVGWLGSPLCGGAGDTPVGLPRLSVQPPTLSSVGCVTGESLPTLLAAGDTGLYGSRLGHPAPTLGSGPCTDTPGMERAEVVDLVSTQLTRRILCDSLAVLSEPAPPGSLGTEEPAGASRVTQSHTAATGQSWGRRDS